MCAINAFTFLVRKTKAFTSPRGAFASRLSITPSLRPSLPPSLPSGTRKDSEELRQRRKAGLPASATGLPWLIVAPASVVRVWIEHLKLWGHFSAYQLESRKDADVRGEDLTCSRFCGFQLLFLFCVFGFAWCVPRAGPLWRRRYRYTLRLCEFGPGLRKTASKVRRKR